MCTPGVASLVSGKHLSALCSSELVVSQLRGLGVSGKGGRITFSTW